MIAQNLLYISMYGEDDVFDPEDFQDICVSGLEKDWIFDWHNSAARRFGFQLRCVDICRGDPLPETKLVDAVIIGGTIHDITEDRPWMLNLADWVLAYRRLQRPLLGICGGHQLVATRLSGGTLATRSKKLTGTYPIHVTPHGARHALLVDLDAAPRFHFSNGLHITPAHDTNDVILASFQDSPAILLDHGFNWFSCQFHPESCKQMWDCRYRQAPGVIKTDYTQDHAGPKLIENFLKIAQHNGVN